MDFERICYYVYVGSFTVYTSTRLNVYMANLLLLIIFWLVIITLHTCVVIRDMSFNAYYEIHTLHTMRIVMESIEIERNCYVYAYTQPCPE